VPKAPRSPKLRSATPAEWVTHVLANFDPFLLDHAACERKASAMAMSLVAHYPDRVQLVETMISFAREELEHFDQVVTLLHGRGLTLGKDSKDEYVQGLRGCIRTGRDAYFLDRLLVSGVVEARGCERFGLIAEALEPGSLKDFYREITSSEARHHGVFLRLARKYFEPDEADRREAEIFEFEAELMLSLPLRAAVH
jgi:tRNA-(ms[2]io[6]A)-hydroxylase